MKKRLLQVLSLALLPTLAACGFQLRGDIDLPEQWRDLHLVSASPNSELSRAVEDSFANNGIHWLASQQASFILYLGNESFERRNLTIGRDASAAEFELDMSTTLRITASGGTEILPETTLRTLRVMTADPENVTGKVEEARLLQREMRTDLVQQLLRKVRFLATSPSTPNTATAAAR